MATQQSQDKRNQQSGSQKQTGADQTKNRSQTGSTLGNKKFNAGESEIETSIPGQNLNSRKTMNADADYDSDLDTDQDLDTDMGLDEEVDESGARRASFDREDDDSSADRRTANRAETTTPDKKPMKKGQTEEKTPCPGNEPH